jgi:hypothetical protein
MRKRTPQRSLLFAGIIILVSVMNFLRIKGCDCIRAIHVVTLITVGIGIGLFIMSMKDLIVKKQQEKDL